jgi:hypothetical protein
LLLILAAVAGTVLFQLRVLAAAAPQQVASVPDDGYYYLSLARNFWRCGYWTFDGGRTVTSGFHPLWAYGLAGVYGLLKPGPDAFVRLALGAGMLAAWAGAATLLLGRRRPWTAWLAVALVWASAHAALQGVSAMEWPLAVLAAAWYWRSAESGGRGPAACAGLFAAGFLGSLARSDFGWMPAAWLLALLAARARGRSTQAWAPLAWGVAGAVAGIAVMLALNALYTGMPLQASALVKQLWAARGGRQWFAAPKVLLSAFPGGVGHLGKAMAGAGLAALGLLLWQRRQLLLRWSHGQRPLSPGGLGLWAAGLTLAGYLALYASSADVQPWYSAGFMAPLAALLDGALSPLRRRPSLLLAAAGLLLAANLTPLLKAGGGQPYASQRGMLALGQALKPAPGQVWAAWDCGIIGYYCDCGLVNLDGLANNDLYPLVKRNHAALYPRQRGITHVFGGGDDRGWEARRGLRPPIYGALLLTLTGEPGGTVKVWAPPAPEGGHAQRGDHGGGP